VVDTARLTLSRTGGQLSARSEGASPTAIEGEIVCRLVEIVARFDALRPDDG